MRCDDEERFAFLIIEKRDICIVGARIERRDGDDQQKLPQQKEVTIHAPFFFVFSFFCPYRMSTLWDDEAVELGMRVVFI